VLAGQEGQRGFRNGHGKQALFSMPTSLCQLPHGFLVVADSANACLRRINVATREVTTLAGACGKRPGFADGLVSEALFSSSIRSIACLANCTVLVGDTSNGRLR